MTCSSDRFPFYPLFNLYKGSSPLSVCKKPTEKVKIDPPYWSAYLSTGQKLLQLWCWCFRWCKGYKDTSVFKTQEDHYMYSRQLQYHNLVLPFATHMFSVYCFFSIMKQLTWEVCNVPFFYKKMYTNNQIKSLFLNRSALFR